MAAETQTLILNPDPILAHRAVSASAPSAAADIGFLTGQMKRGDEAAWRQFQELYFDRLFRYLLVMTGGREDAAREGLQQTMIRAARNMKRFGTEEAFWGWLTVLARSAVIDDTRKRGRYLGFLGRFFQETEQAQTAAPDAESADHRLRSLLNQELSSLPEDERVLMERKYMEDASVRELAAEHQTTEKAVESRLLRVRRKLREAVLGQLHHET